MLRLQRFQIAFELYQPTLVLRVSESLDDFKVFIEGEVAYCGRAILTNVVYLGAVTTCEVKLDEPGVQTTRAGPGAGFGSCLERYERWLRTWQAQERIRPEFKISVLNLHSYLSDLKSLCEQFELELLAHPSQNRSEAEIELAGHLAPKVIPVVDEMREAFLESARDIEPELIGAHESFVQRHLHPLFLCAPFGYRTYQKPLGYAGDYEMMNMIYRNGFEGGSLYARIVHHWLVNQPPSRSVRARVAHLKRRLAEETARVRRSGRPVRILDLGCGPAREVQDFICESPLADDAQLTLLDFDAESIDHATSAINQAKTRYGRRTSVSLRRMSVTQLLKEAAQLERGSARTTYDLAYCGGLFDYLSARICRQVTATFYDYLAPGGLLVVANMWDEYRRFSEMLEFLLDWHLIYRNTKELGAFIPPNAPQDGAPVSEDGVNLFLEVRKPERD